MNDTTITTLLQQAVSESTIPIITAITALIVATGTLITGIAAAIVLIRGQGRVVASVNTVAASLVDEDGKPKIDNMKETVGVLAKNIDGAMTELKDSIAARGLAEGELKGTKAEQERVAELIVEPTQVHDALKDADVRAQIANIETLITKQEKNGLTGTPETPMPVVDDKVAGKLDGVVRDKLDRIQDTVDKK